MTRILRQLDQVRKGPGLIEVRDEWNHPRPDVRVWVEQETHAFLFGCIPPDPSSYSEDQQQRYRRRIAEVFNYTPSPDDLSNDQNTVTLDLVNRRDLPCPIRLANLRSLLDEMGSNDQLVNLIVDGATIGLDLSEQEQTKRLANLYTFCFAHPTVRAIIWRGLCDDEPSSQPAIPGATPGRNKGLLRADLSTKQAFKTLRKLIRDIWHSRAKGVTDEQSRFRFRGFFGDYRVGVTTGNNEATVVNFALRPGTTPSIARVICPSG